MFVFPYSYPFKSFPPVVVGRWHVDYGVLYFSHQHKHTVVDVTLLISAHQGTSSANNHRTRVSRENFHWNYKFFGRSATKSQGLLTSNILVM